MRMSPNLAQFPEGHPSIHAREHEVTEHCRALGCEQAIALELEQRFDTLRIGLEALKSNAKLSDSVVSIVARDEDGVPVAGFIYISAGPDQIEEAVGAVEGLFPGRIEAKIV